MKHPFDLRLLITFLLCISFVFGQEKLNYEPSINQLVKGEEHHKDGEYDLAIEQFNNVYQGDSLYFRYVVHMKMASLIQQEEYQKAKDIGDKYWYFRHELPTEFYLNYGTALDKLEEYDKAQEMYKSILKEYPMNYSLWYNLGVSQSLEGDMKGAYSTFKKTIEVNPFYDRVHLGMARLAFAEQQTSKGLMAVGMYLLHSITRRNNFAQLRYGDYRASSKYWADDSYSGSNELNLDGNSSFETVDQLVHNYVALRDKYKTPSKLDIPLIKQLHLIASQIKDQGGNKNDYWYQTYGKFYAEMLENDQFEGFSYLISSFAENKKIEKIVSRKEKDLTEAYKWAVSYLTENSKEADLTFIGFGETSVSRDTKNHYIKLMGDFKIKGDNQAIVGDIRYYGGSGRMTAEGTYDKNGKKDGLWKYYHPNGRLKEKQKMEDGDGADTAYIYLPNGLLNLKIPYEDGKIKGKVKMYKNGALTRSIPYDDGSIGSGELIEYHPIGNVDVKYSITEGKANGVFKSYYDSEEIYRTGKFDEGDLQGERTTYFRTGDVSYKENFVDDLREEEYISYFRGGQIQAQGKFKEGNKIGSWEYFYRNGNKSKVQNFDDRGKENGLETKFTKEGWKISEHSFKKGVVDGYKYFNEKGEILSQGERKRGGLDYTSYYQNGIKSTEGAYNKVGKDGEWKYYRYNGSLKKTTNYKDGKRVGTYKKFFPNGELEVKYDFNEEGISDGYYQNYYRSNNLYRQGYLKENERDGPWETYHKNGNLKSSNFYSAEQKQGFSTDYNSVGHPIRSMYNKDGLGKFMIYYDTAGVAFDTVFQTPGKREVKLKRCADCPDFLTVDVFNNQYHGEQAFYYPDGTFEAKGKVFNGSKVGPWKTMHPNGQLASEGSYFNGNRHGEWKYYSEEGELFRRSNYEYGDLNGLYETFDKDGDIDYKANYSYGDLNGEVFFYIGKKQDHKRMYNYGYIETYTYINKDGEEVTKEMTEETADITTYWKNGKKAREFSIKNGWFEGPYTTYYESGQQEQDQSYQRDLKNGSYKTYFQNGTLETEGEYDKGNLTGVFKRYYKSGKKRSEKQYVLDELHGESIYYNEDGSVKTRIIYINGNVITIKEK